MKIKKTKACKILIYCFLIFVFFVYHYKDIFIKKSYRLILNNPVIMQNIKIPIPEGVIFTKDEKSIMLYPYKNLNNCDLFISYSSTNNTMPLDKYKQLLNNNGYTVFNATETNFKGYKSYELYYVANLRWRVIKEIKIPKKNIGIVYTGNKFYYKEYFKEIIQNIEFLE